MASSEGRSVQSNLHQQDLSKLDVTKLSALSPEVISRQATINIGTIGHVAHGKSTVVKAISGVQTVRFKNELERNITIKLERLSETIIQMYRDKAEEKDEHLFISKLKRGSKRNLSLDADDINDMPLPKKQKKGKKDDEYIVEKILDFEFTDGKEHFYIKWQGYPHSENTWEPIEHLENCPEVFKEFVAQQELKYCEKFEQIKNEISFDDLLSDRNLIERINEVELTDLNKLKESLIIKLSAIVILPPEEEQHGADLVLEARNLLQMYVLTRKRCRQLMELKAWEQHLNQVDTCQKLCVENNADLQGPPTNFTYINQSIPGAGVIIPDDPPIGCECDSCNTRSKSCCGMQGGFFGYTVNKRLRVASGTPVYECNKACKCSADCTNRVVQKGRNCKLTIFRTSNGCGWGVKSDQKIKDGTFICQYVGEVITFEEAEKRGREYDANGLTYLFDLDFNCVDNPYSVDAGHLGNVSHFINHSCDPNLGVWAVWADCLDPNLPMLALFATRDIEAGEEICFDYLQKSGDSDENEPSTSVSNGIMVNGVKDDEGASIAEPDGRQSPVTPVKSDTAAGPSSPLKSRFQIQQQNKQLRNLTECKCGATKCRKYLF